MHNIIAIIYNANDESLFASHGSSVLPAPWMAVPGVPCNYVQ